MCKRSCTGDARLIATVIFDMSYDEAVAVVDELAPGMLADPSR